MVLPLPAAYQGKRYSADRLAAAAVMAGFTGDDVAIAVAVALAESGGRAVRSPANSNGTRDYGPWQINSVHTHILTANTAWWELTTNAQMAHQVFAERGNSWRPWTTYNTGAYLMFMPTARRAAKNVPGNIVPGGGVTVDPGEDGVIHEPSAIEKMLGPVFEIGTSVFKVGDWIGDPDNWIRVAYVVAGGAMMIGALVIVARPYAMDAAKTAAAVRTGKGTR